MRRLFARQRVEGYLVRRAEGHVERGVLVLRRLRGKEESGFGGLGFGFWGFGGFWVWGFGGLGFGVGGFEGLGVGGSGFVFASDHPRGTIVAI